MPKIKKKQVLTGRTVRVDLKRVRCGRCQTKIGDHASFMLMHVVNQEKPTQHGLVPICGRCFTETVGVVGVATAALRDLMQTAEPEPEPVPPTTPRPN